MDKVSKLSVGYTHGTPERNCGNCSMYREDNGQLGTCTLVAGLIHPDDVCERWDAKDKQQSGDDNVREILIARHGATHLNNDDTSVDRIRGWKDIPLSPQGEQEAHKLGQKLKGISHDFIMSSDLKRAADTAHIVSHYSGAPVVLISHVFRPWNAGELSGQKSNKAVPIMADYADNRPDEPIPGGESYHRFLGRFFCGMHSALEAHPDGLPIIMTHHRNERSLHAWKAMGYPEDGEIDKATFKKKGEGTAGVTPFRIPMDRLRSAADCHRRRMSGEGQVQAPKRQALSVPEGHSILRRARQAPDGHHYIEDPQAQGKFMRVDE